VYTETEDFIHTQCQDFEMRVNSRANTSQSPLRFYKYAYV